MFLIGFPLLLVPFAIYNIVAFLMPGVSWTGTLAAVRMKSGADWGFAGGDVLITFALLLLFIEMVKVVRVGRRGFVEHGLAFVLFGGMVAEFVLVAQAASTVFFLLTVMSFLDLLGGILLPRRMRQREVAVEHVQPVPVSTTLTPVPEPAPVTEPIVASAPPIPAPEPPAHDAKSDTPGEHTPT